MLVNNFLGSVAVFTTHFRQVLASMPITDELGAFILVLVENLQDETLFDSLGQKQITTLLG